MSKPLAAGDSAFSAPATTPDHHGRRVSAPAAGGAIRGYALTSEIHRGATRIVYRGVRIADGAAVIVKTLLDDLPSKRALAGLRREYEILETIDLDGVPRPYDLVSVGRRLALVLAGAAGERLKDLISAERLALATAIRLGIRLAEIVGQLHRRNIIHKDVNPNNVLVDLATERVTVIDFSLASHLPFEPHRAGQQLTVLEGTVAYMSPEQTGRMNRDVDYRTDLYSLGVTIYEILTGRLPFDSADPLEVVHGHIAMPAPPPSSRDARIPEAVSAVVMKALAKTAEERYQSAFGFQADLARCLDELERTGGITPFPPGERDVGDRFVIPQRLYGRDQEVAQLMDAFERISRGSAGLVLVSGYSGIGKTSLIHELHRSLTRRRGYFISGKFDQLRRTVPYAAFAQAFQGLARQLLSESEAAVRSWERALHDALGPLGQVIVDVIPEIERLIGPQPAVPPLGGAESQNRFNLVFGKFLSVFANVRHPLVLFLDDLQWAGAASLNLLRTIFTSRDLGGLLVIGAYRDNEVGGTHPLLGTVAELRAAGVAMDEIVLRPLAPPHLRAFVADALRSDLARAAPLGDLVAQKTGGNPFFVTQFLRSLHQDGLLVFDDGAGAWGFDLQRIRAAAVTDNVVDLMAGKILKLPDADQETLRLAACIGNRFDLRTLATVRASPSERVAAELRNAVAEGLVVPLDESARLALEDPDVSDDPGDVGYRFLHDRVQQAAYALIPEDARRRVHLTIGRLLLGHSTDEEREQRLFEVVDQLNYGIDLLTDDAERFRVAALNDLAGRKARASAAFSAALSYFRTAADLLGADRWNARYDVAFRLHLAIAECEYLCGRFDEAESSYRLLLEHARSPIDRAEVHRIRIVQYENTSRYADAIAAGREALEPFGIHVPATDGERATALEHEMQDIRGRLGDRPIESLVDLPVLADPQLKICMKVLMETWASAYIAADHALSAWLPARMVALSLAHGNTQESASAYVMHGITLGSRFDDYAGGHAFGRLAIAVNARFDDLALRAKVYEQSGCFVNPWREPIRACIDLCRISHRAGLESGDFTYAAYALFVQSWYGLLTSSDLAAFQSEYATAVEVLQQISMDAFAEAQRLILHWGLALQGLTDGPTRLSAGALDEEAYRERFTMPFFRVFYHVPKLHLCYTLEDYRAALGEATCAAEVVNSLTGTIWPALLAFYRGLTLAAVHATADAGDRAAYREELEAIAERLEVWADNCPTNFRHQHLIISAEIARLDGDALAAMGRYEAAIRAATDGDSLHDLALANERYARFWLEREQEPIASVFMTAAYHAYDRWGAAAKTRDLAVRYPALIARAGGDSMLVGTALATTEATPGALDAISVTKAAQSLAGEIDLAKLLAKLMGIVLENAGAQKGILVLDTDGEWLVQAEGMAGPVAVRVLQAAPVSSEVVCEAAVNYVRRTAESVVLTDAAQDPAYSEDAYVERLRPRSVLCAPVLNQGRLIGALYLENNLTPGAFTGDRIQLVQLLSSHAAIAISNARLFAEVSRLRERLEAENIYLQEEMKLQHGFEDIVGRSKPLRRVLGQIEQVAPTDATVLITGETGTGKELIARAIHNLSGRRDRPLITLNCGAISPGLVESELFGHEKGAFTGALGRKIGRFELADGGTIFLDEIGDLQPDLQVKLLRVLQEGQIERVGGAKTIAVDVRVIAATHQPLEQAVRDGHFRPDLYYRLNVFPIHSPPLRDRKDDVPLLVRHFVLHYAAKLGKRIETIPKHTLDALLTYAWPGNVRELRNVIERSIIVSRGPALELGDWITDDAGDVSRDAQKTLAELERDHILDVLQRTGWRVSGSSGAARILGLKPTTLESRMKKLGIQRPG